MSKLREKFKPATQITRTGKLEDFSEQCEQITDDFAVKFAEWIGSKKNVYEKNGKWFIGGKITTTTELLQIFKEKYYE